MNKATRAIIAATATATALGVVGCSGGDSGGKASGLRDDVKHKAYAAGKPAKTHVETKPKTKRVCTSRKNGACKSWSTVPDGTKQVTVTDKPAVSSKPELYCVELDDVNGDKDRDDEWFEVSASTYHKWADVNEGAKVTDMKYSASGCTR
jgi:hypothetical protein